jgi:hypothetical protein
MKVEGRPVAFLGIHALLAIVYGVYTSLYFSDIDGVVRASSRD